jgi:hypothetical protein
LRTFGPFCAAAAQHHQQQQQLQQHPATSTPSTPYASKQQHAATQQLCSKLNNQNTCSVVKNGRKVESADIHIAQVKVRLGGGSV